MMADTNQFVIDRIAQFLLNTDTKDLRNDLHDFLTLISIIESKDNSSVPNICSFIASKIGSEKFPEKIVEESVERLIQKKEIVLIQYETGIKYKATELIQKKLNESSIEYKSILNLIFNSLYDIINKDYRIISEEEKKQIRHAILLAFGMIFERFGKDVASIFYRKNYQEINLIRFKEFCLIIDTRISKFIKDEKIRSRIIQFIKNSLEEPSIEFSKFLFSLSQAYYLIELLNFDPEGQELIASKIKDKKIFLDTNVVINLIFDLEKEKKKIRKKEIEITQSLKYNILVTSRTIKEFNNWITNQKKLAKQINELVLKRFEKLKDLIEDGALKDFLLKKQVQPSLTWEGYLAKFTKIENILKINFGISVDNSYEQIMLGEERNVQDLVPLVSHFNPHKYKTVAEHDAGHIIFIQKIRSPEMDLLGPNSWFLTNDSTLKKVEREYHPDKIPSSIFGAQWIQMIAPFISPDVKKEEIAVLFARIFGSSFTSSQIINEDNWLKIQGSWLDIEGLPSDLIEDVIGKSYVQEILKKKVEEIDTEELSFSIDKAFLEEYKKREQETLKAQQEKEKLIEQHTEEISELKDQFKKQNEKLVEIEKNQKLQKSTYKNNKKIAFLLMIIAILGSLLADVILYFVAPDIWNSIYTMLIPPEFVLIGFISGLRYWFDRQMKKLYPENLE